ISAVPSRPLPLFARRLPNQNTEKSLRRIVSIVTMKFLRRLDCGRETIEDLPVRSSRELSSNVTAFEWNSELRPQIKTIGNRRRPYQTRDRKIQFAVEYRFLARGT
ncbi:hypothetical protein V1478_001206, partial [Vespula squamosa]